MYSWNVDVESLDKPYIAVCVDFLHFMKHLTQQKCDRRTMSRTSGFAAHEQWHTHATAGWVSCNRYQTLKGMNTHNICLVMCMYTYYIYIHIHNHTHIYIYTYTIIYIYIQIYLCIWLYYMQIYMSLYECMYRFTYTVDTCRWHVYTAFVSRLAQQHPKL
jgi:hypothetical protein